MPLQVTKLFNFKALEEHFLHHPLRVGALLQDFIKFAIYIFKSILSKVMG